jgi:hypothetical protein
MYCARPERLRGVEIYGFDFFKNPDKIHYFDNGGNGGHDGEVEKILITDLLACSRS